MLRVRACGLSDVGLTRVHNEDYFEIDPRHRLYVVADGMGGHSAGEVAAQIAVKAIHDFIEKSVGREATRSLRSFQSMAAAASSRAPEPPAEPAGGQPPASTAATASASSTAGVATQPVEASEERLERHSRLLEMAVRRAHDSVLSAISKDGSLHGMGTTVVSLLLAGPTAAVAHVGDSRAYRLRDGRLDQLTQDHTWVHEQVVAGLLSNEQARSHPLKNVVTRALGGESEVVVDVRELQMQPGDFYLLCSDGLTGMLSDADIRERLGSGRNLHEICRSLVNEANARGGLDNVTVVLLAVEDGDDEDGGE
ncbi:MAG TPA: PP2C family serine/threonine-protein phosphatase [Thermoanaerobaculia bacterium]|nr:PP2C family serine/threonine-protein phosphatase [Thermoanaerobaculia bacterium]